MPAPADREVLQALEATTSETERELDSASERRAPLAARLRRAGAAAAAAAALCVVFARGPLGSTGRASRAAAGDVGAADLLVREEAEEWPKHERKGCKNWRHLYITKPIHHTTEIQCRHKCRQNLQCGAINFQTERTCNKGGVAPGTCYLFTGLPEDAGDTVAQNCEEEDSECWDVSYRPGGARMVIPEPKYRASCSNLDSIKIGDGSKVASKYACFEKCRDTKDCVEFTHQPGDCGTGPGHDINWCILLKQGCKQAHNSCNDLYNMSDIGAKVPATAPADQSAAKLECVAGAAKCKENWPEDKQKACCDAGEFCCAATQKKPEFDCAGHDKPEVCVAWPDGHKKVCEDRGEGCAGAATSPPPPSTTATQ